MTALVLSGGGLYCAYQAGAYKAIAEKLRRQNIGLDMVMGASAGALNGWPIAGGCSPDTLIARWLDPATSDLLRVFPNRRRTRAYFDPALLRAQTEKIVTEFQPRIPFGLAVVKLPRFRTLMVHHPHITARHLDASCAIPLLLPSVMIGGARYVDGGLIEKLPLRGAIDAGATRIVAVDALPEPDIWWLRLGIRAARGWKPRRLPHVPNIATIAPSQPLGDVRWALYWKRENIERWIDLGYRDARRALETAQFPDSGISK